MKINKGEYTFDRRRKRIFLPLLYMLAEVTLVWLILSIINFSFEIQTWSTWSHIVFLLLFTYSGYKTSKIYERQKNYKLA